MFVASVYFLFWVGEQEMETPFTEIGEYATAGYFLFFLFAVPFVGKVEEKLILYGLDKPKKNVKRKRKKRFRANLPEKFSEFKSSLQNFYKYYARLENPLKTFK